MRISTINLPATWLLLLLMLLTVVIYRPGLSGDYMFDDMPNILQNKRLDMESLDLDAISTAALSSGSGRLRRPVSMFSFALNRYFFGLAPYSYKVVNLAIHLLTGVLLYLLSRMIVNSCRRYRDPELPATVLTWIPLVAAGLWLVHPLNLTSVLYIVQRMNSLASLFTVCGLCLYVAGRNRILSGNSGWPLLLSGMLVFGGLAVFSKENGALLPLYMLVIELAVFRFRGTDGRPDKMIRGYFALFLLLPAALVLMWLAGHPHFITDGYAGREFTLLERLLTEARVVVFYLKMIVMPSVTELGLYHDDIPLSTGLLEPPTTLPAVVFLLLLLAGAIAMLGRLPLVGLGILWFFCGHLMESTIIGLEIAHEHRNYLPDFGILFSIAALGSRVSSGKLYPLVHTVFPALFILLFSYTTWVRSGQWSDNISHAVSEAAHHPHSYRSLYVAGRIHSRLALAGVTDSYDKARSYLERADDLSKSDIMANSVLIKLSYLTDNDVKQQWIDEILEKLPAHAITPATMNSLYELASCMGGKCTLPHETMEKMFSRVFANDSLKASGKLYAEACTIYGYFTINIRGNFSKGRELFYCAVEHDPREPQRRINLVNLLVVMERFDEAEQQLASFREADTHWGNSEVYLQLQKEIDTKRKEHASSVSDAINGNG